jgi:glycosyltransferase involved in cell wall biosynthesis
MVPVEAQAAGRPVIAYRKGGALETVIPGKTGLFFAEQTPTALNRALNEFEACIERFEPEAIRAHAVGFSKEHFQKAFSDHLQRCWDDYRNRLTEPRKG